MTHAASAHPPLRRRDALGLVLAVVFLHLGFLTHGPLSWQAAPDSERTPTVWTTRQVVRQVAPPASPQTTPPATPAQRSPPPVTATAQASSAPATSGPVLDLDALPDPSQPIGLPAPTTDQLDLPPFNRATQDPGEVQPTAFVPPPSADLKYSVLGKVKSLDYVAHGELQWRQSEQGYSARLEIGAFLLGSRVQTSVGGIGPEGLVPTRFGDKSRSELAAHFQRDKNVISFSANTPDVVLLKGAQDRLSVILQLSALLAADPQRFAPGTMLSFQTVSQREAEVWQFKVEPSEVLTLPIGKLYALKLIRQPRREFDQMIEVWFAPEWQYLPVRLRITSANGDQVDQQLRSIERVSAQTPS